MGTGRPTQLRPVARHWPPALACLLVVTPSDVRPLIPLSEHRAARGARPFSFDCSTGLAEPASRLAGSRHSR